MAIFGGRSLNAMRNLHPDLIRVAEEAIKNFDFIVIQTSRTKDEQEADFRKGTTRAHWLDSPHDFTPAYAMDCAPLPLQWTNLIAFKSFGAHVKRCGEKLGIEIQWGGDFRSLLDMPHFELPDWRMRARKDHPELFTKGKAYV